MISLPKTLNMTLRQFKAYKRKQFKNVCSFIETSDIRLGCAYLPENQYKQLVKAVDLLTQTRDELREWWKNA